MPRQYEAMRDKFASGGMQYDAAQGKAARIYNSLHPGSPVTGKSDAHDKKGKKHHKKKHKKGTLGAKE